MSEGKIVVGVDLHPDSFAAALVSGSSISRMKLLRRFTKVDSSQWKTWLKKNVPLGSIVVMEASGNSFEFAEIAENYGCKAIVLNSVSAGRIGKAYCKNDPKDALRAAKIYLCGLAEHVWCPDEGTRIRREVIAGHEHSKKDFTRASNRIKSFLNGHGVRLPKGSHLRKDKTRQWILSTYKWNSEQRFIIQNLFDNYDHASTQRQKYHQEIGQAVLNTPGMGQLMHLCGIRLLTAYSLIASIGDIGRFDSPKKLVAYLGLAPSVRESGEKSVNGRLQKGGRKQTKSILMQAAQSILKSKNESGKHLREWGIRLTMRKTKNIAVAGIARKLAVAVWYMLKGFIPEIIEAENELKKKMKKVAEELRLGFIQKLGYQKVCHFVDEYTLILLSYSNTIKMNHAFSQKE